MIKFCSVLPQENTERMADEMTRLAHQNKELKLQLDKMTRLGHLNELNLQFEVGNENRNSSAEQ